MLISWCLIRFKNRLVVICKGCTVRVYKRKLRKSEAFSKSFFWPFILLSFLLKCKSHYFISKSRNKKIEMIRCICYGGKNEDFVSKLISIACTTGQITEIEASNLFKEMGI